MKEEVEERVGADKPNPNCQSNPRKIPVAKEKTQKAWPQGTHQDPPLPTKCRAKCWDYGVLRFPWGLGGQEVTERGPWEPQAIIPSPYSCFHTP